MLSSNLILLTQSGIERFYVLLIFPRDDSKVTSLNMKKQTPVERLQSMGYDIPQSGPGGEMTGNDLSLKNIIVSKVKVDMVDQKQEPYKLELNIDDNIATSSEVNKLIDEIGQVDNSLVSMQAKIRMTQIETMQILRDTADEVASIPGKAVKTYETTKQKTKKTIETIQATPDKIQSNINEVIDEVEKTKKSVQKSVDETIDTVDEAVKNIQAIPGNVQRSVDSTVEQVDKTVKDVQAIPGNIEKSFNKTKQKIDATKKSVDNTIMGAMNLGKSISSTTQNIFKAGSNLIQKTKGPASREYSEGDLDQEVEAALKLAQEAIDKASKP